jgi:hypothetical protein
MDSVKKAMGYPPATSSVFLIANCNSPRNIWNAFATPFSDKATVVYEFNNLIKQ